MKFYISFDELTNTNTGVDNSIPCNDKSLVLPNLVYLRTTLNLIRGFMREPLFINSGYRNIDVNSAVGGVPNSRHIIGCAADITCKNLSDLKFLCHQLYEQGILVECVLHETYIHIAI